MIDLKLSQIKKTEMLVFGSKHRARMTGKKDEIHYSVLHTFHNKAQSSSSSSTLPVMSPFFKPRNDGKLCSQKTSCPTSRTQLSWQGVTHTEGLIIVGKKVLFLGHLNNGLKGCSLPPSSAKPSIWFPVVFRVDSLLDNRVDSRTSRGTSTPVPQALASYQLVLPAL